MKILVITDMLPYPPVSGGLLRVYNLLSRVAKQHQVTLIAPQTCEDQDKDIHHLKKQGYQVTTAKVAKRSRLTKILTMAHCARSGQPLELGYEYREELTEKIKTCVSAERFDIIQVEQSHMAHYLAMLPQNKTSKRILMLHDVDFAQADRMAHLEQKLRRKLRLKLYSRMMRRWEPRIADKFDRCTTVSEPDRQLLTTANPRLKVDVIPNGVDTTLYQPLPLTNPCPTLLFIGNMSYLPCIDAMRYFCREIFPHVLDKIKDAELWIVGKEPAAEVKALADSRIHVTGQVEDIVPYYKRCTACIVPLRAGGGTRLKILEAMALGRPVISTTIGREGLDLIDREEILIADTPQHFTEATLQILSDLPLRKHITTKAREKVVRLYDWDASADKLMQIYKEVTQ